MSELKDSGARRSFDTGAVRDVAEGKGRCDYPLDVVARILDSTVLYANELELETSKT